MALQKNCEMKPNVRAQSELQPNRLFCTKSGVHVRIQSCNYSSMSEQRKPCKRGCVHTDETCVQRQVCEDDFMCVAVNCQMEFPLGTSPFFVVFFDFPLTFTEKFQPGGSIIGYAILYRVGVLKLTLTNFARLLTLV